MKRIEGFDYVTHKKTALTRHEWTLLLVKAPQRRVEKGETFAHDENGVILFEVYANIQTSPTDEPDWLA